MREHQAIFANFIVKFAHENLADYLLEVVMPAFTDDTLVRPYGRTEFHLLDVDVDDVSGRGDEPAIYGRFVKNTYLTRTQFLESGKLVQDADALQSSPSSFFVLTLSDHRLVYYGETPYAPDVSSFQATMARFIDIKYEQFIHKLYLDNKEASGSRVTKISLRKLHQPPTLEVVPISNSEGVEKFIRRYAVLKKVEVTVHKRNDTVDFSDLMESVSEYNEQVGGAKTKVTTTDPNGLDVDGTIEALKEVTDGGNQTISLDGTDVDGNRLTGDNADFSVRVDVEHPPHSTKLRARRLYDALAALIAQGVIRNVGVPKNVRDRIAQIIADSQ